MNREFITCQQAKWVTRLKALGPEALFPKRWEHEEIPSGESLGALVEKLNFYGEDWRRKFEAASEKLMETHEKLRLKLHEKTAPEDALTKFLKVSPTILGAANVLKCLALIRHNETHSLGTPTTVRVHQEAIINKEERTFLLNSKK